jgi:hypothetical protein
MPGCVFVRRYLAFVLLMAAACGPSVQFQGRVFDKGIVRYRVGPQTAGFERIAVAGNDLAWHDARHGTISVNSTCRDYEDVPPRALLNHLWFGTTERVYRVDETVPLNGRAAQHVIADVELDGVPVTVTVYLLVKDGCVFDLTQVAGRAAAAAARPLFDAFVRDFAVLSTNVAHEQ